MLANKTTGTSSDRSNETLLIKHPLKAHAGINVYHRDLLSTNVLIFAYFGSDNKYYEEDTT